MKKILANLAITILMIVVFAIPFLNILLFAPPPFRVERKDDFGDVIYYASILYTIGAIVGGGYYFSLNY